MQRNSMLRGAGLTVVGFPFVILPLYFKYRTLKYEIDDEGVSMSWGLLFQREIYLTYRRIQDIHVSRNVIHRWLGLADVAIQTASGSAGAEMTIEGVRNPEALRDYLYARMRGVKAPTTAAESEAPGAAQEEPAAAGAESDAAEDEALILLREIRDALRARRTSEVTSAGGSNGEASS